MISFTPHPEIALNEKDFDSAKHKACYRGDYVRIFEDIKKGVLPEVSVCRTLILQDLWFIVYFVMEVRDANHPHWVKTCQMVEKGPKSDTLDIWARYHGKSSIITIAETLQYELKNPEHCTGILAYSRPAAKKFLRIIKSTCERSDMLKQAFPDVMWQKPESQSPKWSEDDGLVFKRQGASRGESSVEAWGLTEGMPTGRHFERLVFDDLETEDIRESPDMLNKVFEKFQMAGNLGTGRDTDITRVIGTYYSYFGPNVKIRDMKYPDERSIYKTRLIPASDNGTREGNPILLEPKSWEKAKTSKFFNSQQLCDPTPLSDIILNPTYLKPIEHKFIPKDIYKFMVIDQAGDDKENSTSGDSWSIGCIGIKPCIDEIGASDVYLLDLIAGKMTHAEAINHIVQVYVRNGIVMQLGVEKVGLSTTEIHIVGALRARGRYISIDNRNLVLLKPAGRSKEQRIEAALQWPLTNGKLFYSTDIPDHYIDMIKEEMLKFPFYHVDILDMWAYAYDMFKEFRFMGVPEEDEDDDSNVIPIETGRSKLGGY